MIAELKEGAMGNSGDSGSAWRCKPALLIPSLALVLCLNTAGALASHRGHVMTDPEGGLCIHGKCARTKVRIVRAMHSESSVFGGLALGPLQGQAARLIEAGSRIDRTMSQLLVINETKTE